MIIAHDFLMGCIGGAAAYIARRPLTYVEQFVCAVPAATREVMRKRRAKQVSHRMSFQHRVHDWMLHCFGPEITSDTIERNHRFFEEATELVQTCGCTASEAHQLVDYVFGRPVGDLKQEIGGVMVTLAALCNTREANMQRAAEDELDRVWTKSDQIRAKQAAKPKHSPLPA